MKEQVGPVWHANGTVMMGKPGDLDSCVDTNFRVHGLQSLRVADLSVCPFTAKYVFSFEIQRPLLTVLAVTIRRAWHI
jgi:choline dehydrogenase-like flavoprotein